MKRLTIAEAAREILGQHRALSAEALGEILKERGLTRARSATQAVTRALDDQDDFLRLSDGRWSRPRELLDGATLAHRIGDDELARDSLALDIDLVPIVALSREPLRTADGRALRFRWEPEVVEATGDADAVLEGPHGWLTFSPGDLVQVRVHASVVDVDSGAMPDPASRMAARRVVEAVRSRLEEQREHLPFLPRIVHLEQVILDLLVDDPELLAQPMPPFGEALRAAGLETHRGSAGLPGTDWKAADEFWSGIDDELDDELDDDFDLDDLDIDIEADDVDEDEGEHGTLLEQFGRTFDLTEDQTKAVFGVLGAVELVQSGVPLKPDLVAAIGEVLDDQAIVRALARISWSERGLEPVVVEVERQAQGRAAASPRFLLGALSEGRGEVLEAERQFQAAVEADPAHAMALTELSRYEFDRGNYDATLTHLRAAGTPVGDPDLAFLESHAKSRYPSVGRNEPCPCGSGRKYKHCHLALSDTLEIPPVRALLHKLELWLSQIDTERIVSKVIGRAVAPAALTADLVEDAGILVADICLFDRGQLARFLKVRGVLLPAAEVQLARSWLGTRRSLYEVERVRGADLTVRDMLASRTIELHDAALSHQVQPLDVLLSPTASR